MKHDFDILTIIIHGVCTKCHNNISNSKYVTRNDFKYYNMQPHAAFTIAQLYESIDKHICSVQPKEPEINQCSE